MASLDAGSQNNPTPRTLSDRQKLAWLRLIRTQNVGPITFRELINHFGGAEAALEQMPDLSMRGGRKISPCPASIAERELAQAVKIGARLVAVTEPGYPPLLAQTETAPPLIYVKGQLELSQRSAIAIVGARNGSSAGKKLTRMIAAELGRQGFAIVSGLARGIDKEAHAAALVTGTIAVVAGGIDYIYPPENEALQNAVAEEGLLISERPPGISPRSQDFPRRNRIISGISLGTIVVEAALRSGSLITARFALEQNREVFAVPGNPLDPRAAGTNKLIKDGATLITGANDVIDTIAPIVAHHQPSIPTTFRDNDNEDLGLGRTPVTQTNRETVLSALSATPVDVDELIRQTGCSPREMRVILLELDLAGRIEHHGSQLVSLLHQD